MSNPSVAPVVLLIRDGWGLNPHPEHAAFNAVEVARGRGLLPTDDRLRRDWPWTLIKTSGEDVGLPPETMGNSEVGHQNIGAGRVVPQESLVMTRACKAGLDGNAAIRAAVESARSRGGALHLLGINSDAGVHGLLEHLEAILAATRLLGMPPERVFVHLFTDGRDTGPYTGLGYARHVDARCRALGVGRIASVIGRYFAMDRDHRWERVGLAYNCLTGRANAAADGFEAAIQRHYDHPAGESERGDEFVPPTAVGTGEQIRESRVRSGDSVIFYNYRGDRPRELSAAFVFPDDAWAKVKPSPDTGVVGFDRGPRLDLHYVTMTDYWDALTPHVSGVAFPKPPRMRNTLGEWLSERGITQFRCAETEKYPHVTFFFNDYREERWPGEVRENPPSPKVKTYDQMPEMSAAAVTRAVLARLSAPDGERVLIVNYANADMVGHTGSLEAAVRACQAVDAGVGAIVDATLARGGSLIVAADHGNAEQMWDPATNAPHTAHTVYDVPLYVIGPALQGRKLRGDRHAAGWFDPACRARRGRLGDIAPTVLSLLGIPQPPEMTGLSLLG